MDEATYILWADGCRNHSGEYGMLHLSCKTTYKLWVDGCGNHAGQYAILHLFDTTTYFL
jgi:hypothetical protein